MDRRELLTGLAAATLPSSPVEARSVETITVELFDGTRADVKITTLGFYDYIGVEWADK
jgi:hypothetical protein